MRKRMTLSLERTPRSLERMPRSLERMTRRRWRRGARTTWCLSAWPGRGALVAGGRGPRRTAPSPAPAPAPDSAGGIIRILARS